MAYLTPVEAKDDVYRFFTDKFNLLAFDCEMRYQGFSKNETPPDCYIRLSMQQVLSPPRGFTHTEDGADTQVFETSGLFFAMVNVAISSEDSFRKGDLIATAARDIVRAANTPSGVWLRNARFNELPSDGEFYKWRVVSEYEFNERSN